MEPEILDTGSPERPRPIAAPAALGERVTFTLTSLAATSLAFVSEDEDRMVRALCGQERP